MSWAQRRKATYTLSFLFFVFIIFIAVFFSFFNKKPTCFDGVRNGVETGVDCGGACTLLCPAEYTSPSILWVRWTKVLGSGSYNILAYGNNSNIGVGANNVSYSFRIYDKDNILLYTGQGSTYIPPSNNFPIFDDGINIYDKIPARIVFEFQGGFQWQKLPNKELDVKVVSQDLIDEDVKPRLLVTLNNTSTSFITGIESVAILYDEDDNATAFSRTKVDVLRPNSPTDIVFTWPERFERKVYKIEVISKVLPR